MYIEEFILPEPDNYKEILRSADELFAEFLIKYHFDKRKDLTTVNDNSILSIKKESNDGRLFISN